jgi:hypothetical protein
MQVRLSSAQLRRELGARNLERARGIVHESTYGAVPSVLYQEVNGQHGNFLPSSYRRICASPDWSRRLRKCYTDRCLLALSACSFYRYDINSNSIFFAT